MSPDWKVNQIDPALTFTCLNFIFFLLIFQVSIEFGLCEMMSREAIRLELAPKDGNWGFNVSELEAMLPAGTVDTTVERVYQEVCMTLTYFLFFFAL